MPPAAPNARTLRLDNSLIDRSPCCSMLRPPDAASAGPPAGREGSNLCAAALVVFLEVRPGSKMARLRFGFPSSAPVSGIPLVRIGSSHGTGQAGRVKSIRALATRSAHLNRRCLFRAEHWAPSLLDGSASTAVVRPDAAEFLKILRRNASGLVKECGNRPDLLVRLCFPECGHAGHLDAVLDNPKHLGRLVLPRRAEQIGR